MRALRLGIIGDGHLARTIVSVLDHTPHVDIVGSWGRSSTDDISRLTPDDVDLVVELATHEAVRDGVAAVVSKGIDALILSVGALADPAVRARLVAGPGHAIIGSGAIGGLDYIRGLRTVSSVRSASIETRKLPSTLIQPDTPDELRARLEVGAEEIVLADAPVEDVVRAFPKSANVAATVAIAADAWERTRARVIADPAAVRTLHRIEVVGAVGTIRIEVENDPSPQQPRSSEIVAWSVLRAVFDYAALRGLPLSRDLVIL